MSSYPPCRECGDDLMTMDEREQELCVGCQEEQDYLTQHILVLPVQNIQTKQKPVSILPTMVASYQKRMQDMSSLK
jgi:hypothetical protein